jgi:23S rRNA G2445 N2-methylase RlmL
VVTNPPYGERLEINDDIVSILEKLNHHLSIKGMIILHPVHWTLKLSNLRLVHQIPFSNQGLKLFLTVFQK